MYNHELKLVSYEIEKDEIGNDIKTPVERSILCRLKSIGQSEFYNASTSDFKPEVKFIIHKEEYQNEGVVIIDGVHYQVIRTFEIDFEKDTKFTNYTDLKFYEIELTCQRKVGSGAVSGTVGASYGR